MSESEASQIYLVGFMGAGKTTVGRALADRLGWEFADLDERICQREGKGIPAIFREQGEAHFRRVEREVLTSLTRILSLVIATGGGTYVAEENRSLVEAAGWSVWLRVGLAEALRRCSTGGGRPLLGTRAELEALFRFRQEFYRCARTAVATEGVDPEEVADRVIEALLLSGAVRGRNRS